MLTFIVQSWAVDIKPDRVHSDVGISVTRLDGNKLEVMVMSVENDTSMQYLIYKTPYRGGMINRSASPMEPLRDAGDPGIISVSGYDEKVEIFAVSSDAKIKIFSSRV